MAQSKQRIRSSGHRRGSRDGVYAVLATPMLIFVAAASYSDGKLIPDFVRKNRPAADRAQHDSDKNDKLRSGSVLITSRDGNVCERREIDNATWRVRPAGRVECDEAVTWHPRGDDVYTAQSRIEAIRDGFVSKR